MKIVAEIYKESTKTPLVIAYFTVDTPYQHEAEALKESLNGLGYGYWIVGVPNLGSWQKNTQYKAQFIKHALEKFSGKPLLYLDVDSIMVSEPEIFNNLKADIAAVHFAHKGELLSGTLWLGNTAACNELVKKWIQINEKYPETLPNGKHAWDQRTLKMAIKETKNINYVELPQAYTWIAGLTQMRCPEEKTPIIMHTRGAKRFKRLINGQKGYAK